MHPRNNFYYFSGLGPLSLRHKWDSSTTWNCQRGARVYPPAASPAFIFGEKFHQNEKNKKGYSFIILFIFL
jgi:hypothetical protein